MLRSLDMGFCTSPVPAPSKIPGAATASVCDCAAPPGIVQCSAFPAVRSQQPWCRQSFECLPLPFCEPALSQTWFPYLSGGAPGPRGGERRGGGTRHVQVLCVPPAAGARPALEELSPWPPRRQKPCLASLSPPSRIVHSEKDILHSRFPEN